MAESAEFELVTSMGLVELEVPRAREGAPTGWPFISWETGEAAELIRKMAQANVTWGAPRIRNELVKLGIELAVSTVAKYMPRRRKPPSPTWRAFLENHRTARQVIEAFPEETAPRFLLRDRDKIYGERFRKMVELLGIEEVVTAARSPWQNPYAERLIGSIRRDCLDHIIVLDEVHLRRILAKYFEYYNETRCHLSLRGDAPGRRAVQGPERGKVVEFPELGGLHHRYERAAA
jgi:transposase InsO family protein